MCELSTQCSKKVCKVCSNVYCEECQCDPENYSYKSLPHETQTSNATLQKQTYKGKKTLE